MATAGRKPGQEGGTRREARALLRDKFPNWHPLVQMAETAQDPDAAPDLRLRAACEETQYLMHKLRSVELTGEGGGPIQVLTGVATDAGL